MATRAYIRRKPLDPEFTRERARKARAAQLSVEHYVQKIAESRSELTDEHIARLRSLLVPAGGATE
ncbi:hypothetical protein [Streptomyces sp. MZ04]|uniref:hypothetical protein n=1 Tax=Streptomyces sp. MZ04 TaxID=2559236 RepID=UPI00107EC682|nr:hypothetical protein [Streptomyces sp. MZ04]TGB03196.1 hypothetical protein E2651_25815 [Streptomyces sp. MZ04]